MMLSYNRFAFIPHLCLECKRYIWLEGYRKADVLKRIRDSGLFTLYKPVKENICKDCLTNIDVKLINVKENK